MTGPYDPPQFPSPSFPEGNWDPVALDPPPVMIWFKVHMVAVALLHLVILGLGFFLGIMANELSTDPAEVMQFQLMGFLYVVWGLLLTILYTATLFLPLKPWAWITNLVALCVAILSGCCIVFPIILIIFWVREDVRRWYGMR